MSEEFQKELKSQIEEGQVWHARLIGAAQSPEDLLLAAATLSALAVSNPVAKIAEGLREQVFEGGQQGEFPSLEQMQAAMGEAFPQLVSYAGEMLQRYSTAIVYREDLSYGEGLAEFGRLRDGLGGLIEITD